MEQVIDWLNENENRAYPLMDNYTKVGHADGGLLVNVPENLLLDLQIVTQLDLSTCPNVLLKTMEHSTIQNIFKITFGTSVADITEFTITNPTQQTYPLYIRNTDGCLGVFGAGVLTTLAEISPDILYTTEIPVEPTTCMQFNDAWLGVSSLSTSPEKTTLLGTLTPKLPLEALQDNSTHKLTGDITFIEGYNFYVGIFENLIDLSVGGSYGLKMSCDTSFISEEYLDCDELVSYINGIPPDADGNFKLEAGTNISITSGLAIPEAFMDNFYENANAHSLFVGMAFSAEDICTPLKLRPSRQ